MREPETSVSFACEECGQPMLVPARRCGHVETCGHCGSFIDVPGSGDARLVVVEDVTTDNRLPLQDQRWLWCELAAVVCLGVLPDFYYALASFQHPPESSFAESQVYLIVRALQVSLPVLVIMALSQATWKDYGIVRPRWLFDVCLGCVVWGAATACAHMATTVAAHVEWASAIPPGSGKWFPASGIGEISLLVLGSLANAFGEQLVLQGYLLTRFERLLGSTVIAVVLTALLFTSYHVYQGSLALAGIAAVGVVNAIAFCLTRRLWPLCISHALMDFLGAIDG